jgi:hypothetical protein
MLAATGGFLLMNIALFLTEYSERRMMHGATYYYVTVLTFCMALSMLARAINLRWSATASAALFTAFMLVLMWTIEFFPATPKLGPIYRHITHMVTLSFPPLVIVPAFFVDLVMHRFDRNDRRLGTLPLAAIIGPTFTLVFVAAQWPFASFLLGSPLARGRVFNADNFVYWMSPIYEALTKRFDPPGVWPISIHLGIVAAIAILASALGLVRGDWMTRVRR